MLVFSSTAKKHPKLQHLETVIVVGTGVAIEITRTMATSMAAQATGVLYLNKDTGTLAMLATRPTHGHLALMAINKADLLNRVAATNIAIGLNLIRATYKTNQHHQGRGVIASLASISKFALLVARVRRLRYFVMPVRIRSAL
jgi:hypothetical protein